jgi:hypothetical protein
MAFWVGTSFWICGSVESNVLSKRHVERKMEITPMDLLGDHNMSRV